MTHSEFILYLKHPENLGAKQVADLRTMTEAYPYLTAARALLVRALINSDSIHSAYEAQKTSLYVFDRRWFYFFLYPEKLQQLVPQRTENQQKTSSGDYFDMLEKIESQGGDTKTSLRKLAEKLKEVREFSATDAKNIQKEKVVEKNIIPINDYFQDIENQLFTTEVDWKEKENEAKKLIAEKNFSEALDILREINFKNPKKSVYFADQIRFLEKIT
jgi:hypothetical protein